jgi:hypothetical protein
VVVIDALFWGIRFFVERIERYDCWHEGAASYFTKMRRPPRGACERGNVAKAPDRLLRRSVARIVPNATKDVKLLRNTEKQFLALIGEQSTAHYCQLNEERRNKSHPEPVHGRLFNLQLQMSQSIHCVSTIKTIQKPCPELEVEPNLDFALLFFCGWD